MFYAKKERKKEKDRLFPTYNNKITFKNTIIYVIIHCFFESSIQVLDTASENRSKHWYIKAQETPGFLLRDKKAIYLVLSFSPKKRILDASTLDCVSGNQSD